MNRVGTLAGTFADDAAAEARRKNVGVVARAAVHVICAAAGDQGVVAAVSIEVVVPRSAGDRVAVGRAAGTVERDLFDVAADSAFRVTTIGDAGIDGDIM